jgi:hypothetical protein
VKVLFVSDQNPGKWEYFWRDAFKYLGHDVVTLQINMDSNIFIKYFGKIVSRLPYSDFKIKLHTIWSNMLTLPIIKELSLDDYDIFFCYNDVKLSKKRIDQILKATRNIWVLLGDNPFFYNHDKFYFLYLIEKSKLVITADKVTEQNVLLFNKNVYYTPAGTSITYYRNDNEVIDSEIVDVLFVGNQYGLSSFGYHRAKILSAVAELDINLKIYGNDKWKEFDKYFPNLKNRIIYNRISNEELIEVQKKSKIYLVTTNPWLVNGIPDRTYNAIASGTFVIAEHRDVYAEVFGDTVPTFKTLGQMKELITYYINNDSLREELKIKQYNIVCKFDISIILSKILSNTK